MTDGARPPYCLSRQHPELAARSPASQGPINRTNEAPQALPAPASRSEKPSRKHL